jgi:ATP-dependent Clp protease protease subunit
MGIDSTEFVKLMYKHSSSGNWREYATKAVELKWVNNVVMRIEDKSILVDPLLKEDEKEGIFSSLFAKEVEKDGEVFVYLPRLRPTDAYFIYNPDGYYRDR